MKYILFLTLSFAAIRHIAEAIQTQEAACDFLKDLDGTILPAKAYYENESYLLQQHQHCLNDKSKVARKIKRKHDGDTIDALEAANEEHVTISVFGGSSMTECDPNWGSAVRIGYEFENMGYHVLQGGGAGLMMALRIGSDLFCQNLKALEHVVTLMCEAKTASNERQQEIKLLITEQYATCQPQHSHSLHGAFWLTRMPIKPYIGFGADRVEIYNIYAVLAAMVEQADIWIAAPGSSGTVLEYDATLVQTDYRSYLNPDKQQHLIVFNTSNWESNEQVHPKRLHRTDVQHANTAEEVIEKTNMIVLETICKKKSYLQACSALMYSQSKIIPQEISFDSSSTNRLAP